MTKDEMISEIYRMDPSYKRLNVDLNKYTEAEILHHYNRKKNAPASIKSKSTGWYESIVPKQKDIGRTDGFEIVETKPKKIAKQQHVNMDLQGLGTIKKEDLFKKEQ